jgi:Kef-type K+ transport system membrane component KefB
MTNGELSALFFLAMACILAASRLVGWAAQRFLGQPQVVGEMIAGVLLGPSLLGYLAPGVEAMLFPAELKNCSMSARNWAWDFTCFWSA